ncbi:hypothetical protein B0T10DRAFT_585247 [Thelonectria olida]|uniref:F-box domain-containing protein n=1 Tax=Thelonectria olida TaxID=1576542 RepID=A0A9P9ALY3_9HYPO|nr:hypothetical protein B0T10DRAFT_585247 [Thelonectria olida]
MDPNVNPGDTPEEFYCAICGGPLRRVEDWGIGSTDPRALKRRDARVSMMRRERGLESGGGEEEEFESMGDEKDGEQWTPEPQDLIRYDPRLVSEENATWLADVRYLGFNPCVDGMNRAFITGRATYHAFRAIAVQPGVDPAQPGHENYSCYHRGDWLNREPCQIPVFPFHPPCLETFARTISPSGGIANVDKDILFDAMSQLTSYDSLDVDYGNISGKQEIWEKIIGEEFTVANPLEVEDFRRHLTEKIVGKALQHSSDTVVPGPSDHGPDPFDKLPLDILRCIAKLLPAAELVQLYDVSQAVHQATHDNQFWKQRLLEDMPWLWDMGDIFSEHMLEGADYKSLYSWLDTVTDPVYGVKAPFLSIANRRRIWNVSLQIEAEYSKKQQKQTSTQPIEFIVDGSHCPYSVKVANTNLFKEEKMESCLWAYSREEMNEPYILELVWDHQGALAGLGIVAGTSRRMLGSGRAEPGHTRSAMRLKEWIHTILLHIGPTADAPDVATMAILGVSVCSKWGIQYTFGNTRRSLGIRPLLVTEGYCLVGVTGQVDEDGRLVRLGILQCAETPTISTASEIPLNPEEDLVPYQVLLWTEEIEDEAALTHVSALVAPSVDGSSGAKLLGLKAKFMKHMLRRFWFGTCDRRTGQDTNNENSELMTVDFHVKEVWGERVTEIGVPQGEELTGLMLRTNRGRSMVFGENNGTWAMHRAPEERCIVGVAAAFLPHSKPEERKMVSLVMLHASEDEILGDG